MLRPEMKAAPLVNHGFDCSTPAAADDGFSAGLSFDGHDSEILDAGEHQGAAIPVKLAQLIVRDAPSQRTRSPPKRRSSFPCEPDPATNRRRGSRRNASMARSIRL